MGPGVRRDDAWKDDADNSLLFLAERRAKRMAGIDADNPDLAREEF
jgi:hypothetical protein